MKWFKFYGQDFLTDPKLIGMDPLVKHIWVVLLCLADETGNIRHLREYDLLRLAGTTDASDYERTKGCLKIFEELEMITIDNNMITIKNFLKRQKQNLSGYERVKKYRQKKKNEAKNDNKMITHDNVINDNARIDKNRIDKNKKENNTKEKKFVSNGSAIAVSKPLEGTILNPFNELIKLFEPINPSWKRLFSNKTERSALERLIGEHGEDGVERLLKLLAEHYGKPYCPSITTPYQLEKRLGDFLAYLKRQEAAGSKFAYTQL